MKESKSVLWENHEAENRDKSVVKIFLEVFDYQNFMAGLKLIVSSTHCSSKSSNFLINTSVDKVKPVVMEID